MDSIKDRNGGYLVDAEEIKKRWKEYIEKTDLKKIYILINLITTVGLSATKSQNFWKVKSSGT